MKNNKEDGFSYTQEDVDIFANALKDAFESVGCDMKCFDWINYNPIEYIKK